MALYLHCSTPRMLMYSSCISFAYRIHAPCKIHIGLQEPQSFYVSQEVRSVWYLAVLMGERHKIRLTILFSRVWFWILWEITTLARWWQPDTIEPQEFGLFADAGVKIVGRFVLNFDYVGHVNSLISKKSMWPLNVMAKCPCDFDPTSK
jgi:hypothetical protein